MNVLVTGGTGFLGGALARRLQAEGHTVTALGRDHARGQRLQAQGVRFIPVDFSDAAALTAACRAQAVVFHCGALSAPWGRYLDFYAANVTGTEQVVRACQQTGVRRLVHVSTPSLYFAYAPRLDVRETDPLPARQVTAYAQTKLQAEQVVRRAMTAGWPAIIVRPRAIFGPGDTSLLPRLIARLQTGRLPIIGDGQTIGDLTGLDNLVDALVLCLQAPEAAVGRAYNITNGEPIRVWDQIAALCDALGLRRPARAVPAGLAMAWAWILERWYTRWRPLAEPPLTRYMDSLVAQSATLNIDAAHRELGYQPRQTTAAGLAQFVDWWKATHP